VVHVCLTSSTSKRSFNAMLCRFFGLPGHDKGNAEELVPPLSVDVFDPPLHGLVMADV
jgi:hypothetical protein